jgi:hypothetical protein
VRGLPDESHEQTSRLRMSRRVPACTTKMKFAFVEPVSQQRSSASNESHLTADPPSISLQQAPGSAEAEEGQVRDTLMCTHQRRISLNINPIGSLRRHMTR